MSKLADQYEKLYPGTGVSEAHAEERMERILFKNERDSLQRTARTNTFVVPDSFEGFEDSDTTCKWVEIGPGRYKRVKEKA